MKENWKKYLAECIGTAVLTFAACGVAVVAGQIVEGQLGWWVATSLAFGLVIVAMAYSIGNISGCHINPAVSLAMLIRKKITLKDFCFYVIAQVVGALVGSLFLALCLRGDFSSLGGNEIQPLLQVTVDGELKTDVWSLFAGFFVEVLLTFIFVIAILGSTDERYHDGKHAGIVIGLSLTLVHLLGLGFTGTSVNPARSLAPALLQAFTGNTIAGAALAAIVYGVITKGKEKSEPQA